MIKRYLQFVKPYTWHIVGTIIIGILKFGIPLLLPLLIKFVIDDVINNGALSIGQKTEKLTYALLIMGFIFIVLRPPIEYFRQYLAQWTSNKILYDIRKKLYTHLQALSSRFYANNKAGEVISRVINDVEQTKDFILTGLMNVWLDLVTIVIALSIMFVLDIKLTFAAIAIFPLFIFSIYYFFGKLRRLTRKRSQSLAELQGFLHERVSGMSVIKSFAIEKNEEKRFDERNRNFLTKATEHTLWNAKSFAVINTVTDLGPLLVVGIGGFLVINGQLTVGTLAAFVAYLEQLHGPLRRLVSSSTTLTQSIASMDRVFHLFDEKYDVKNTEDAEPIKITNGDIEFENVSFKYNEYDDEVLHQINLNINKGETVAFVGMSGGGKSTLISLIPRFYDVTEGELCIDGVNIKDVSQTELRDKIGFVPQKGVLFSGTIESNIKYADDNMSDEQMVEAARIAQATEFIEEKENKYKDPIAQGGGNVSGGQKQRLSIARAIAKDPEIFVFDDSFSALDFKTDSKLREALSEKTKDKTVIIVAQRISTVINANQIIVLEEGKVVGIGTHEELMKNNETYRQIALSQLSAEELGEGEKGGK